MDEEIALKCPYCLATNARLHTRTVRWSNGITAAIFACMKCHRILSISTIENQPAMAPFVPSEKIEAVLE